MASKNIKGITIEIGAETTGLSKALSEIDGKSRKLQSELKGVESLLKFDPKNTELLAQKQKILSESIENTKEKLEALRKAEKQVQQQVKEGKVSEEQYRDFKREIIATEQKLKKLEDQVKDTNGEFSDLSSDAKRGLNKVGDTIDNVRVDAKQLESQTDDNKRSFSSFTDNAKKGLSALKIGMEKIKSLAKTVASGVKTAFKTVSASIAAAGAAMVALAESTREYREDLSKLETNAAKTGKSIKSTKDRLKELNAITGETDSNIEALSNLMQAGLDDNQIKKTVDALSGAVIAFPDTLKIESLSDSLQETIATGKGVGQYSELLERCGFNLDIFNSEMEQAKTKAEKQNVALRYLAKTGMASVNSEYRKTNKSLIDTKNAQYDLNDAMAGMGEAAEPAIANVKSEVAEMINELTEDFKKDGVSGVINGIFEMINAAAVEIGKEENRKKIAETGSKFLKTIISGAVNSVPELLKTAFSLAGTFMTEFAKDSDQLKTGISTFVKNITKSLSDEKTIKEMEAAGEKLMEDLMYGISYAIPDLVELALKIGEIFARNAWAGAKGLVKGLFGGLWDRLAGDYDTITNPKGGGGKSIPAFANGGTLYNGQAIVAEAGPELIQMLNGKAVVTPLSSQSKNTQINTQPIVIHTHVDLDGRAVGKGITPYVSQNQRTALGGAF